MRHRHNHERGAALLLVLFALAIGVILAVTFLNASSTSIPIAQNVQRHAEARAIAEGALEMTINYVQTDADWRTDQSNGTWLTDQSLGAGTFDIAGVDEDDGDLADDASEPVHLTAVGRFDGVSHRVSAVVTPESLPANNELLFVVLDATSMTSQDQAKQTQLDVWGYNVSLIEATATLAEIDAAVALADVVYVSEEINATDLSTKLTDATIGIVSEDAYLNDELGISSGRAGYVNTQIDITDNTHYITQPFSTGPLTIATASADFQVASGTLASGIQGLAEQPSSSNPTLLAIDAGEALVSGSAAGRRVMLPGGPNSFDFTLLNSDGLTIVKRAIEWAAVPLSTTTTHGLAVDDSVHLGKSADIDSFESSRGSYGPANKGAEAVVNTNSTVSNKVHLTQNAIISGEVHVGPGGDPGSVIAIGSGASITGVQDALSEAINMPTLVEPSSMPASEGDYSVGQNGSMLINTDRHFNDLTLGKAATLTISGDVTVLVDGDFHLSQNGRLELQPGSSLTLYCWGKFTAGKAAQLNMGGGRPSDFHIFMLGNAKTVHLTQNSDCYAQVQNPAGDLFLGKGADFYGTFQGRSVDVTQNAGFHQDLSANSGDQDEGDGPRLIALYEFEPVTVTPQLLGHWKLDEVFSPSGGNLYDYANRTQGTDIFAYSDQSTSQLPSNGTTPGGGSAVLNSGEYDDIELDDGSEFSQAATSNNRYPRKRFEFHLDEAEADVNSIDVSWKGRGVNENNGRTDGAELYIWKDQSPSEWTLLDTSPDTEATVTLSGAVTVNLPDYISTGDVVSILVVSADKKSGNPERQHPLHRLRIPDH